MLLAARDSYGALFGCLIQCLFVTLCQIKNSILPQYFNGLCANVRGIQRTTFSSTVFSRLHANEKMASNASRLILETLHIYVQYANKLRDNTTEQNNTATSVQLHLP